MRNGGVGRVGCVQNIEGYYFIKMEAKRQVSRVILHDSVYQTIQQSRYSKHLQTLENMKLSHSQSAYQINEHNIAGKLDRYKRKRKEVEVMLFPRDVEYKNCLRRLNEIAGEGVKLPQIKKVKRSGHRDEKQEQLRINKENKILLQKFDHLQLEKQLKRRELSKSIEKYQSYKSLTRRFKTTSLNKQPSPR